MGLRVKILLVDETRSQIDHTVHKGRTGCSIQTLDCTFPKMCIAIEKLKPCEIWILYDCNFCFIDGMKQLIMIIMIGLDLMV